jgi:calcineurin-like phosphoesterase family protein
MKKAPLAKKPLSPFPAIACLAVVLVAVGLLVALPSSLGLLQWVPTYRPPIAALILAGCLPLALFAISAILAKAKKTGVARGFGIASIALAILLALATFGATVTIGVMIHKAPERIPAMNKLDATKTKSLVHIAISSDPHFGSAKANTAATNAILDTVNAGPYDAFFVLGDLSEMGWPGNDPETAAKALAEKMTRVPFATVMGNHDALIGGAYRYRAIFNDKLYYRLDFGTTHIIAIDLLWGMESFDGKQKKWLETNLASIPESDTVIVLSHCFVRSSGYVDPDTGKKWFDDPATIRTLEPILEKGNVDLVVSGHNHFMEYLEAPPANGRERGTGYAIIGAMGGLPDLPRTYTSPYSKWYQTGSFGFLDLAITPDGFLTLTFRDPSGNPIHEVTR